MLLSNVPLDYLKIFSGLGSAPPQSILVMPIVFEGQVKGVLELASFDRFSPVHEAFLDQLAESIGIVINTITANTRTEDLLTQSQSLAQELQSRQLELQNHQELEEKAGLARAQNQEVERKNQEWTARQALEKRPSSWPHSKYKSEFLANMCTSCARREPCSFFRPALQERDRHLRRDRWSSPGDPSSATTC